MVLKWRDNFAENIRVVSLIAGLEMKGIVKWRGLKSQGLLYMCVCVPPQVKGGVAEADGRLMPGDQILSVNGQDFRNMKQEDAATLMKVTMETFRNKETVDCGYNYV